MTINRKLKGWRKIDGKCRGRVEIFWTFLYSIEHKGFLGRFRRSGRYNRYLRKIKGREKN